MDLKLRLTRWLSRALCLGQCTSNGYGLCIWAMGHWLWVIGYEYADQPIVFDAAGEGAEEDMVGVDMMEDKLWI